MKKILFICHGNICRSPMAEFVMKDLVKKAGLASQFHIESAATSREEIGNPVYPPARRKLAEHGISCEGHAARQLTNRDYDEYDLLIGMDQANLRDMYRICGGDYAEKDVPPDGPHRSSRQCGRPVVHRGLRGDLAGCAGRLPGTSERILITLKGGRKVAITEKVIGVIADIGIDIAKEHFKNKRLEAKAKEKTVGIFSSTGKI